MANEMYCNIVFIFCIFFAHMAAKGGMKGTYQKENKKMLFLVGYQPPAGARSEGLVGP